MNKNSEVGIALFERLSSLHFLSPKESFLLLLELCLLKYLSKNEIRNKNANSYEIDDKFCFENIVKEINNPDIINILNDMRTAFANSGKTKQADKEKGR